MRQIDLDQYGLGAEATTVLAGYLSELYLRLPGGRRARTLIVTELADGLACAVEASVASGAPPAAAARRAVAESGDPGDLAAQFAGQMLSATAHRTGVALVLSGPALGLLWAICLGTGLSSWPERIAAAVTEVPALPVILVLTIPSAVVAAFAGGRLGRRVVAPVRCAYRAALLASSGCVVADASLIGGVFAHRQAVGFWLIAASVLRATLAGSAVRRLLRQHAVAH